MEIVSEVHAGDPISASKYNALVRVVNELTSVISNAIQKLESTSNIAPMTHVQTDHDFGAGAPAGILASGAIPRTSPGIAGTSPPDNDPYGGEHTFHVEVGPVAATPLAPGSPHASLEAELGIEQYFFGDERNIGTGASRDTKATGGNAGAAPIAITDRHGGASLAGEHRLAYFDPVSERNIFVDGPPKTYVCRVVKDLTQAEKSGANFHSLAMNPDTGEISGSAVGHSLDLEVPAMKQEDGVQIPGVGVGWLQHIVKTYYTDKISPIDIEQTVILGLATDFFNQGSEVPNEWAPKAAMKDSDAGIQFLNLTKQPLYGNEYVQVAWYPIAWQAPIGVSAKDVAKSNSYAYGTDGGILRLPGQWVVTQVSKTGEILVDDVDQVGANLIDKLAFNTPRSTLTGEHDSAEPGIHQLDGWNDDVDVGVTSEVGDANSNVILNGYGRGLGLYVQFDGIRGWTENEKQVLVYNPTAEASGGQLQWQTYQEIQPTGEEMNELVLSFGDD